MRRDLPGFSRMGSGSQDFPLRYQQYHHRNDRQSLLKMNPQKVGMVRQLPLPKPKMYFLFIFAAGYKCDLRFF
jgi:hypothetical protein